jgi:putative hydrolase of the HAD superfamily
MFDTEFVFDLDDTLYREHHYVRSALSFVGRMVEELFSIQNSASQLLHLFETGYRSPVNEFWSRENLPHSAMKEILAAMRAHQPNIKLDPGAEDILDHLRTTGRGFSIITDGRSVTQRAKLAALDCLDAKTISISDEVGFAKTEVERFLAIQRHFPEKKFIYVGDNPQKDFIVPNMLGWVTVMIQDDGTHIHKQDRDCRPELSPKHTVTDLKELSKFL